MQVNVLWPLKCLPWAVYATIIIWVQLILIIPLSTILWQEFYQQLIPVQSRYEGQLQPEIIQGAGSKDVMTYQWNMSLNRLDDITAQTVTMGIISADAKQEFPLSISKFDLPKNIPYFLNLDIQVYCFDKIPIHNIELRIDDVVQYFTISCFLNLDSAVDQQWNSKPMAERIKREFMNHFFMPDISIAPNQEKVLVTMRSTAQLLYGQGSRYELNMHLGGLRYIMLRWNKTFHVLGSTAFVVIISGWFYLSFTIGFAMLGYLRQKTATFRKK
ncbi:HCL213Wp [Eremothecium sinecaudum]|uniref:HCL213Wp n=1 Tax=Eremothecium sinecaudum TaxID=45286 RepID=A0A109UZ97_9SACH|nr:HCL213Wp [Eremothecium sinecaudum]AMD19938.1 HCL213Wp [Eremothecium sinecaudum]